MSSQLGKLGFDYSLCYITDRRAFDGVFNDKSGRRNGLTSRFQTNLNFVYSVMILSLVLDDIVKNTSCQRTFDMLYRLII